MNNYPTPMNTLVAFGIVFAAGVVTTKLFQWARKKANEPVVATSPT